LVPFQVVSCPPAGPQLPQAVYQATDVDPGPDPATGYPCPRRIGWFNPRCWPASANIAHAIKNPLNFANDFSALSVGLTDELNKLLKTATPSDKGPRGSR
jgi:hypothetical protein